MKKKITTYYLRNGNMEFRGILSQVDDIFKRNRWSRIT